MPLPFEKRAVEMALKDSKGRNIAEKIDKVTADVSSVVGFDGEIIVSYIPSASRYVISAANLPKKTGLYKLVSSDTNKVIYGWCRYLSTSGGYQGKLDTYLFNGLIYIETDIFSTSSDKTIGSSEYRLSSGTVLYKHLIRKSPTDTMPFIFISTKADAFTSYPALTSANGIVAAFGYSSGTEVSLVNSVYQGFQIYVCIFVSGNGEERTAELKVLNTSALAFYNDIVTPF